MAPMNLCHGAAVAAGGDDSGLSQKLDELQASEAGLINLARQFKLSFSQQGNPQNYKKFTIRAFEQARAAFGRGDVALATRIYITIEALCKRLDEVHLANRELYFGILMADGYNTAEFDKDEMIKRSDSMTTPLVKSEDIK